MADLELISGHGPLDPLGSVSTGIDISKGKLPVGRVVLSGPENPEAF
jgi:hypothetical protein